MNANGFVLSSTDVPDGFILREWNEDPSAAKRMFGKARFLRRGDAIWSEAHIFASREAAHEALAALVTFHIAHPGYLDVEILPIDLGDESHLHTGTMGGRPGLWAAVRSDVVVHRFNTLGVSAGESLALLRRQVEKTVPQSLGPAEAAAMARNALQDIVSGRDQRETIPVDELVGLLEAIRRVTPSARDVYGLDGSAELSSSDPSAYEGGSALFPYAPPEFADVIEEATRRVEAFHAAFALLTEMQQRDFLQVPFPWQPDELAQDAIAAWCVATGGVYDRRTGSCALAGESSQGTRLQRFLAISSSMARAGDVQVGGVAMPDRIGNRSTSTLRSTFNSWRDAADHNDDERAAELWRELRQQAEALKSIADEDTEASAEIREMIAALGSATEVVEREQITSSPSETARWGLHLAIARGTGGGDTEKSGLILAEDLWIHSMSAFVDERNEAAVDHWDQIAKTARAAGLGEVVWAIECVLDPQGTPGDLHQKLSAFSTALVSARRRLG